MRVFQKPSSLLVTRVMVGLLLLTVGGLYLRLREATAMLDKLSSHAYQVYPYLPVLDRFFDFTVDFYGLHVSGNTRTDYELYFTGAAEKPELFFLRDLVFKLALDDAVFVDVGACKGNHSLFMSRYVDQVVSFEPYPLVLARFQEAIEVNRISNIILRPVALGESAGQIPFYCPKNHNHYTGSFSADFSEKNEYCGELEMRKGDEELALLGVSRVDIVKTDVEGYEKHVLSGLRKTLVRDRPTVMLELLPSDTSPAFKNQQEIESAFPEGYKLLQFSDYDYYSGRYRLTALRFEEREILTDAIRMERPRNIIAYPQEIEHLVPLANLDATD